MKTVTETPTEPVDYALITGAYASLLAASAFAARRNGNSLDSLDRGELLPIGAATFAVSKALANEKVETWLRGPFVAELPEGQKRPKGRRLRYAIGELLTCTRCLGAWSGLALVTLRLNAPQTGRIVTSVFAASAANDFLQAGFSALCAKANSGRDDR